MAPAATGKSQPAPKVWTHAAPKGLSPKDFVSYEDAAGAMIDAAEVSTYDGQLIQVVSPAVGRHSEL